MQAAYVLVASDPIDLDDLCEHLNEDGLAVLNTTHENASAIAGKVRNRLGVDAEREQTLSHLSAPLDAEGWSDLLVYSATSPVSACRAAPLVEEAVKSWRDANSPRFYMKRIDMQS